ncbi:MAG: SUMF1/EgtB/PvdO family nonheme iron enzyme, partial [Bacteroidales bacterium]|nr:SUMF1/EgtB/PvdO family nonheme iron enzyme [Bacteroidales bacterium]
MEENKLFGVNGVTFTMIAVQGGTYTMGAADNDPEAYDWEKPAHKETVSDFMIGETPVTQELWQAVMGSNPSS